MLSVLEPTPALTSAMFIRCGYAPPRGQTASDLFILHGISSSRCRWAELAFIRNTGAAMGAAFGLLQVGPGGTLGKAV